MKYRVQNLKYLASVGLSKYDMTMQVLCSMTFPLRTQNQITRQRPSSTSKTPSNPHPHLYHVQHCLFQQHPLQHTIQYLK